MSYIENSEHEIDEIIKEIKRKSRDGNYIYRGERKEYCKVSSALYREHMKYYESAKNNEYIKNREYINTNLKDYDLRIAQRERLQAAKKHIGEPSQDINEDHKESSRVRSTNTDDHRTILKADEIEILTELQHYGGITNLIDFTTDYLIAIYFACAGESKENGRVIVLEKTKDIDSMIIRPYNPQHRVIAQKSIFLYPPQGFVEVPDVNIVTIPKHLKHRIITHLRKYHDISAATIYNDIHGVITYENIQQDSKRQLHLGLAFHIAGLDTRGTTHSEGLYKEAIKYYDSAIKLDSEASDA